MTPREALKTAIRHIEHMAAFIGKKNAGYSFESLGEDMPGMKTALQAEPVEIEHAALIVDYYRCKIGRLMQQAQHWHEHGKPLAVHHRVMAVDNYFQIVALFETLGKHGQNPFETMQRELNYPFTRQNLGPYPPTPELHAYRDVVHVAKLLASVQ